MIALSVSDTGAPYFSLLCLLFLIGFFVLLVRDVITLSVVTRSHLLTPRTLDLTMPRVSRLVLAACFFSSFDSRPMRTFYLLFPHFNVLLTTFDFTVRDS